MSKTIKVVEGITLVKGKHTFAKVGKEVNPEVQKQLRKESKRIYNKQYYEKNTKKISEYHANLYETKLKVQVICPKCGRSVSQQRLAKHQLTKLCQKTMEIKNWIKED